MSRRSLPILVAGLSLAVPALGGAMPLHARSAQVRAGEGVARFDSARLVAAAAGKSRSGAAKAPPSKGAPPKRARQVPFSRQAVLDVVKAHAGQIQACYEDAMAQRGSTAENAPSGRLVMSWVITPQGLTAEVKVKKSDLHERLVTDCMVRAIRFWEFPKPKTRQPVEFPFELKAFGGPGAKEGAAGHHGEKK